MDPIQALAILSLGAFVAVLVTALFYVFTVRPRLLDPEEAAGLGVVDDRMGVRLASQHAVLERLSVALTHQAARLEAASRAGREFEALRLMLRAHAHAVESLTGALRDYASHVAGLDDRLSRQETALERTTRQVDALSTVVLPQVQAQIAGQTQALQRLEAQPTGLAPADQRAISGLVQAQIDRLMVIADRLDAWASVGTPEGHPLAEQARVLSDLDRQLITTARAIGQMETKISEHTALLVTAETERREQASLVDRILYRIGELSLVINQVVTSPSRPEHDRLTEIKGIGPVYAGKLYEAGIFTYRQLASMSPDVLKMVIDEPEWRARAIDARSWIEQAHLLAEQREKVEAGL